MADRHDDFAGDQDEEELQDAEPGDGCAAGGAVELGVEEAHRGVARDDVARRRVGVLRRPRRDVEEAINNAKGDFDMAAAQAELAMLAAQVAALRRLRKKS